MSFKEIKGQERQIGQLKGDIGANHVAGGYLFTGPQGIGKMTAALAFAQALNCASGTGDPCGGCAFCLKIRSLQHPDVHIFRGDSGAVKIDDIRRLQKEVYLRPYEARKKVFIIDNAHLLTAEASGALLKILEEPPADSVILILSFKPALLFKTIISRCRLIKFQALRRQDLASILKRDYGLEAREAHFMAYFYEGRVGRAIGLKSDAKAIIREKNRMIDFFTGTGSAPKDESFFEDKQGAVYALNVLAAWLRDLYLEKTATAAAGLINIDRVDDLRKAQAFYSADELIEMISEVADSFLYIEQNANLKLVLLNLKARLWKKLSMCG